MIKNSSQKSALVMFSVLISIVSITFLISILARGYIPEYDNGLKIKATGILSAISVPKNASVFINDKLYTTTDDSVNLEPSSYQLKIVKDGYLPWNKKIDIQKEMVTEAEATLFKSNPILSVLSTQDQIIAPTTNNELNQIIYMVLPSTSTAKPGLYLIETNYLSIMMGKYQPRFIVSNPFPQTDKTISFTFSPNSKQVVLKSNLKKSTYLVDLTQSEQKSIITEIATSSGKLNLDWATQSKQTRQLSLDKLPKKFTAQISTNPASIQFSSDETKFLYTLLDKYFVYDIDKNINFSLNTLNNSNRPFWIPKTHSIVYTDKQQIKSMDYDGTNNNTIYTGEAKLKTLIPQFDGEKIIISTDNIYSLTIR